MRSPRLRQTNRFKDTSAFTLVELLVVIAIIGILVSLLLPAVNSAREASRRTVCKNNIRQAALAVINFESAQGALPSGAWISKPAPTLSCNRNSDYVETSVNNGCFDIKGINAPGVSWIVSVLPYMEEQSLYDQFDFTIPLRDHPSTNGNPPFSQTIGSLICPSDNASSAPNYDGFQLGNSVPAAVAQFGYAKGNFAAYLSPVHMNHFETRRGALGGFKLGEQVGQKLSRLTDGLSKTALGSEVRTLKGISADSRGVWAAPLPGGSIVGVNFHDISSANLTPIYNPDPNQAHNVRMPNSSDRNADQLIGCKPALAAQQGMPCRRVQSVYGVPRSLHPGGVHLVMMDSAVGFMSDDIDVFVYAFLVCAHDGRPLDIQQAIR